MRLYKLLSVSYIQYSNTEFYLKNAHCKTILFCILVYPSIISLFKHLSRLVCIEWYHYALLAAVLMFLRASSRCCVRNSPCGIPLALALSLLWVFERDVGLNRRFQTAYCPLHDVEERAVRGSIFGSVFGAGMTGFQWAGTPPRYPDLSSPAPGSYRNAQHSFRQQLLRKTKVHR